MSVNLKNKKYISFHKLANKKVVDKNGSEIGKIKDIIFNEKFDALNLVVKGSIWEQLAEKIGMKKENELLIPLKKTTYVDGKVKLLIPKEKLKTELENKAVPKITFHYTQLENMEVVDRLNRKLGRIKNLLFLPCNATFFIVGGSKIEEIAESLGLVNNKLDLLVPKDEISIVLKETIKLNVDEEGLHKILNENQLDPETTEDYLNQVKLDRPLSIQALGTKYQI
ncbi:MAG: PRC-barrel domain containing protein [Asgard group archaeon]|nr:PRC-barrel domain containing protein [Asgard group archaeon]